MIKRKLKTLYHAVAGKKSYLNKIDGESPRWYGNEYGGFYVCPDKIARGGIVYSFGVGEDVSFDLTLIKKHKCTVFAFDPTPRVIDWVRFQELPTEFIFKPYGIAETTGEIEFYLPRKKNHISGSLITNRHVDASNIVRVPMKTFADITKELKHSEIEVLKMDIEGAEYGVIPGILKSNVHIKQIVVEFHDRLIKDGKRQTSQSVNTLKDNGYEIAAISATGEEMSFVKKY